MKGQEENKAQKGGSREPGSPRVMARRLGEVEGSTNNFSGGKRCGVLKCPNVLFLILLGLGAFLGRLIFFFFK